MLQLRAWTLEQPAWVKSWFTNCGTWGESLMFLCFSFFLWKIEIVWYLLHRMGVKIKSLYKELGASLVAQLVKNPPAVWETPGLNPESGRFPGEAIGYPIQYSCLENPHGQWSLAGYSPWGCKKSDMTERLSTAQDKEFELPRWHRGKESACQCRRHRRLGFNPWVRKIPWSRKWQPTPVFAPGKSHGQKSLADYSLQSHKESDMTKHTHCIKSLDWCQQFRKFELLLFLFYVY